MKKSIFLFLLLFSSCATKQVIENSPEESVQSIASGKIQNLSGVLEETNNANDIYYNGDILSAWDSSLLYLNFLYDKSVDSDKWKGSISTDGEEKDLEVTYVFSIKDRDKDKYDKKYVNIQKIEGLSETIHFKNIKVSDRYIYSSKLPHSVFSFSFGKEKYYVNLTNMKIPSFQQSGVAFEIDAFVIPEQIYTITDSSGKLIAKFTEEDYSLYTAEYNKEFKEVISLCVILRQICKKI